MRAIMSEEKRTRKNQIHFFLDDDEFERFEILKERSGLSTSALMRQLINGCQISEAPPVDFWDMTKQIRYYGNNLNQIAKRMNLFGLPDVEAYQRNADKVFALLDEIQAAVLSKRKR